MINYRTNIKQTQKYRKYFLCFKFQTNEANWRALLALLFGCTLYFVVHARERKHVYL